MHREDESGGAGLSEVGRVPEAQGASALAAGARRYPSHQAVACIAGSSDVNRTAKGITGHAAAAPR